MSNTRRMTVNVPVELYERCSAAIDGVYLLNMSQLVLVAMSDLVAQKQSPPLPSSPLHPPTPNTPPIISPKGDIYTPPNSPPKKSKPKGGLPDKPSDDFLAFWELYPRKKSRKTAWKAYFAAVKLVEPSLILRGLEAAISDPEDGFATRPMKYIPYAQKWINNRGWDDALSKSRKVDIHVSESRYEPAVDYSSALDGESCEQWPECLERISDEVGGYDFNSWFRPVRAICVGDTIIIGCPDKAHAEWLMQNYRETLSRAIGMRFRVVDAEELSSYLAVE